MGILEVKNVNKRFGGLQALGDVNLSVAENTGATPSSAPTGRANPPCSTAWWASSSPIPARSCFDGQSVLGRKPYEINQMGISRVFQTPEIFGDLTVLENMMIPIFAKRDGAFRMHAIEQTR